MTTASPRPREYKKIQVTGSVSVERVDRISQLDLDSGAFYSILIMGPTGAGKSTLIESLGLHESERISSNRLEGFTQTVSTYRMKNVVDDDGDPIYLIDSPGFADTKISEMAIISMLQKWRKDNRGRYFTRILYLTPITQIRLPGSQRQVLKTFQELTGVNSAINITIVSTMWDSLGGRRATTQAEMTYKQLEGDIWKDFIGAGARLVRFHNTKDSSLTMLDEAMHRGRAEWFNVERNTGRTAPFAHNVYTDLQDRIQNLQLEITTTQAEVAYTEVQDDQLLRSVLIPQLEESKKYLAKFQQELEEYGPPPSPHPFGPVTELDSSHEIGGVNIDEGARFGALERGDSTIGTQTQRRPRWRALELITGCGCCGSAVEANHEA